jgi:hypothetical protein
MNRPKGRMPLRSIAACRIEKRYKKIINIALQDLPMDGGTWGKAEFGEELD